jgi:hypothetical protein
VLPPETVTAVLYAVPTVPPGRDVVVTARLLGWLEFAVPLVFVPLQPARSAVDPTIRPHLSLPMV